MDERTVHMPLIHNRRLNKEREDKQMSTDKLRDDFLFDMAIDDADSETMEWLGTQDFYQKWLVEQRELVKKYPCIDKVLENEGEVSLTKEEHEALTDYLKLQQKKESAERREYYRFGHVHAKKYWHQLNHREVFFASNLISGIGKCKNQKLPQWSDGFIERLDKLMAGRLRQNDSYKQLKLDEKRILQENPIIVQLMEGGKNEREITLSMDDQKALEEFFTLKIHMDSYREMALYIIGQEDLIRYFSMLLF